MTRGFFWPMGLFPPSGKFHISFGAAWGTVGIGKTTGTDEELSVIGLLQALNPNAVNTDADTIQYFMPMSPPNSNIYREQIEGRENFLALMRKA
jgi:hypothetical protein